MKEKYYYVDIDKKLEKLQKAIEQDKKDLEEFDKHYNKVKEATKRRDENDHN